MKVYRFKVNIDMQKKVVHNVNTSAKGFFSSTSLNVNQIYTSL